MSTPQDSPVEKIFAEYRTYIKDALKAGRPFREAAPEAESKATKDINALLLEANIEGRKLEAEHFGLTAQVRLRKLDNELNELKGSK